MTEDQTPFSDLFRRYLNLLWRWAWLLVLAALLAGGTAYFTSARMTPVYQASTLVLIHEAPGTKLLDYTAVITSERLAQTYAELMTTRPVLEGLIQRLGIDLSVGALQGSITVSPLRDTQLIRVVVESANPGLAAMIANALVDEFAEQNHADQAARFAASKENLEAQLAQWDKRIQQTSDLLANLSAEAGDLAERDRLEASLAQYRQAYASLLQSYEQVRLAEAQSTATVLQKEPAVPSYYPVRPRTRTNTLMAIAASLVLSIGSIILFEALDETLRDPEEAERQLGLPVLGIIASHANGLPVASAQPRSPVSEAFRALRTNLQFVGVESPLRTLLVTSPTPQDGKSTVAADLAVVLAQSGLKVVLLDADMRRPNLHRQFGLNNREGLSGFFPHSRLAGQQLAALEEGLLLTETPGLRLLTSGRLPPNPAELLGSENMQLLLEQLGQVADFLVIDSPPVLVVTDAAILAPKVDGVLLVIKPGETKLGACKRAVEQLRRVGANLLGVVLNDVDLRRLRFYYNYKEYYSSAYNLPPGKPRRVKELAQAKEAGKVKAPGEM